MSDAPAIVELRDVVTLLGEKPSLLRATRPPVRAVDGVSLMLQPGETKTIRGKIYVVGNDPAALEKRYQNDFPQHSKTQK